MSSEQKTAVQFSVIIAAYNAGQTIARALDSVLSQSFPAHEIIVVDDASTDDTFAIIRARYPGVKVIQKLDNYGGSVARNTGMEAATGNYIAFLDADDAWHRHKLMLIKTILESNPGINLFYHPYTQNDILGKNLPENVVVYKLPFVKLLPGNIIATSCAVIRNDPSFRFDPVMRYSEDYDLWLRIGYKHRVYFVNIPLTQIYRPFTSKGGVSEKKWKMRKGEMRAYRKLVRLNPLFIFLLPFLILSSLGKHVLKMIMPAR